MSRTQRGASPATYVLAVVALVAVVGAGSAYAGVKIGTSQLKNNAVTSPKIKGSAVKSSDVKNGSLDAADLSAAARSQLKGVNPYAPPPSRTTVIGGGILDGYVSVAGNPVRHYVPLGFPTTSVLRHEAPGRNMAFGHTGGIIQPGYGDATNCSGTFENPTAPAGWLCLYVHSNGNVQAGTATVFGGVETTASNPTARHGFHVKAHGTAAGTVMIRFAWAYTAP